MERPRKAWLLLGIVTFILINSLAVFAAGTESQDTSIKALLAKDVLTEEEVELLTREYPTLRGVGDGVITSCGLTTAQYSGRLGFTNFASGRLSLTLYKKESGNWVRKDNTYKDFSSLTTVTLDKYYSMSSGSWKVVLYVNATCNGTFISDTDSATN